MRFLREIMNKLNAVKKFISRILENQCIHKNAYEKSNLINHSSLKKNELQNLMGLDYPRFSSILPYRYFDTDTQIFINEMSIGFALELAPLTGANEEIIHSLSEIIKNKIPDNISVQIMMIGTNKISDILENYFQSSSMSNEDIIKFEFLRNAALNKFSNPKNLNVCLRDYRCFLFISKSATYTPREISKLVDLRKEISADLKNTGISNASLDTSQFITLVKSIVNPTYGDIDFERIQADKYKEINEQVVSPSFFLKVNPDYLDLGCQSRKRFKLDDIDIEDNNINADNKINESRIISFSLKHLPEELVLWDQPNNFCNIFKQGFGIQCPFVISVHFRSESQEQSKLKAFKKSSGYEKKANSPAYSRLIPGTVQAAQDWKKIRDELASDKIKLCKTFFNVILFSNKETYKEHISSTIASFRINGIDLYSIRYQHLQSFLSILPFTLDQGLWSDLQVLGRLNTMTTWNLANILPIVADFKGSSMKRGVFAPTFRNQAATFNIFDKNLDNYNTCICATSGSGKSVLAQAIIDSVLAEKGIVWVIDLGQSYKKSCELKGGLYLDAQSLKLNPFAKVKDISRFGESIRDLIAVMASPIDGLTDVQKAYLLDAVLDAYSKHGQDATIDHVVEFLDEIDKEREHQAVDLRIGDLIILLKRFCPRYSSAENASVRIFNESEKEINKVNENKYIVLELGDLQNQPDLLKPVLFALILQIEEEMYHGNQNQKKLCVIDEAWRLLSGSNKTAASFIEKGFRTARKHNGSFLTITQRINDFYSSSEAQAAWSCSENRIIMRQNEKSFKDFISEHPEYFDAYQLTLIKNFRPSSSIGFSEFMLQQGSATSFHRLFLDPFSRVMYSSRAEEHSAVKEYVNAGYSIKEAIGIVANSLYSAEINQIRDEK